MTKRYMLEVDYDYGKYHELSYSICDGEMMDVAKETNRMCYKNFLCSNTEEFVYQIIFKMIFPINKWKHYKILPENDYMDVKSYIMELLSSDFAKNNDIDIHNDGDGYYQDKLHVFRNLLEILDQDRIENRID